jgi:hypothetical protein
MVRGVPEKKLRWGRLTFAFLLLAAMITGAVVLVVR